MDNFLPELLNLGAIVRTLILFVVTFFIGIAINRYLSYRNVKSINLRIKDMENEKLVLDYLIKSDRSILLYSFISIFEIISGVSIAFMFTQLSSILERTIDLGHVIFFLIMAVIGVGSWGISCTLKKVQNHPESIDAINQKIDSFKARLSKLIDS